MEGNIINRLEELKGEIEANADLQNKEVWFFNQNRDEDINGYWGTDKIIFLALNPSKSGNEKATRDFRYFFDKKLIENGFVNAHITDLIKICLNNKGEVKEFLKDKDKLNEQLGFLKREIKIIIPKIIVFVGRKAEKEYKKKIKEDKTIRFFYIMHYANPYIKETKKEEIYNTTLKEIREEYEELIKNKV